MATRRIMYEAVEKYFIGKLAYHSANVETQLSNPVAIGEHGDIMEELDKNIGKVAEYEDKLETLRENFEE